MKEKIEALKQAAAASLKSASTQEELEALRVKYLGKKGELTGLLKQLGAVAPEERPKIGQLVNEAKQKLEEAINENRKKLADAAAELKLATEAVDITLPAKERKVGVLHPLNRVLEDMIDIFSIG